MNVNGIPGAVRSITSVTPVQPVEVVPRDPHLSPLVEIDKKTMLPVPLRFPWLSRLSRELEKASGQHAPFAGAPEIGDTVDEKA